MAMTNISETTEIISDGRVTAYSEGRRIRGQPSITTDNNAIVLCNFSETFFYQLEYIANKTFGLFSNFKVH